MRLATSAGTISTIWLDFAPASCFGIGGCRGSAIGNRSAWRLRFEDSRSERQIYLAVSSSAVGIVLAVATHRLI